MPIATRAIQAYMKEHLWLYAFVAVLFVTGVVFGAVMANALTLEQKQEIDRYLGSFFQSIGQASESGGLVSFQHAFAVNLKWLLLIWILGLSVVGMPLIFILDFLKGVLVGFTVGYLAGQYAWKGVLFALISVAPQNLLILPAIVICSVSAMAFSLHLVKNRFLQRGGPFYLPLMRYCYITLAMTILVAGASVYESYFSHKVMSLVTPMIA